MLPLKVRDIAKTSSSLLCLQRKTTGCTTYSRTPSLTWKAVSQGIMIPGRAVKETQVSKQICATIWSTAQAEDRSTRTLVLLNHQGGQRNWSENISHKTLKKTMYPRTVFYCTWFWHSFSLSDGSGRRITDTTWLWGEDILLPCLRLSARVPHALIPTPQIPRAVQFTNVLSCVLNHIFTKKVFLLICTLWKTQ